MDGGIELSEHFFLHTLSPLLESGHVLEFGITERHMKATDSGNGGIGTRSETVSVT
jgi:hypothetical protein